MAFSYFIQNDNKLEDDNGRVAIRDLVGFVEFKKYKNDS